MSLDTVLKIGKTFREANKLRYHRFFKRIEDETKGYAKHKNAAGKLVETTFYKIALPKFVHK